MTREDYTIPGEGFDAVLFDNAMGYDTWFEETTTMLLHSVENVMDCVHSRSTNQGETVPVHLQWRQQMDRLARVALRSRQYDYGSRPMNAWFDEPPPLRSHPSSVAPDSLRVEPASPNSEDGEAGVFDYWQAIGTTDPSTEHRVWDPDGRVGSHRRERRDRTLIEWRRLERQAAEEQELADEFQ